MGASVGCGLALAGIKHEDISESLVEIIDIAKSSEMVIEVVSIVFDVFFTQRIRNFSLFNESTLDLGQTGVESVVALRGEEKVVVGLRLEEETFIACSKGVDKICNSDDGDEK